LQQINFKALMCNKICTARNNAVKNLSKFRLETIGIKKNNISLHFSKIKI
jgi:hypothetical protein